MIIVSQREKRYRGAMRGRVKHEAGSWIRQGDGRGRAKHEAGRQGFTRLAVGYPTASLTNMRRISKKPRWQTFLLPLSMAAVGPAGAQPAAQFDAPSATSGSPAPAASAVAPSRPSLIVLITVDQFRADYLDRFRPQLKGGLARLLTNGAVFTDAHHDHAITETAPGHATLLSGRYPRSTNIMLNRVGVEDVNAPLIDGGIGTGASPARFQGTALLDWLLARDSKTRSLSVSMKDRGAILPFGRTKTDVYWYSIDGRFVTSSYYASSLPTWVKSFNDRKAALSYAGKQWTLLLPESEYKERDSVVFEGEGLEVAFPHPIPTDPARATSLVRLTPYIDELTLSFALHGLNEKGLGTDNGDAPRTDLLAVSLSATDVIGHRYGPDSREMHDQVLQLDRLLGVFLDSLYKLRDSTRITIALSSDHGVGTIPEVAASVVPTPNPMPVRGVSLYDLLPPLRMRMAAAKVDSNAIDVDGQILLLSRAAFKG
ncbi:MAG: alkaline phosphatase family protein, partial [Gemmatimonas sp.]